MRSTPRCRWLGAVLCGVMALSGCRSGGDERAAPDSEAVAPPTSTASPITTPATTLVTTPVTTTTSVPTTIAASSEPIPTTGSAGCGIDPVAQTELELDVDGERRTALLRVPAGYDPAVAVPLLFDFHGHGGTAGHAQRAHRLDTGADPLGAITVYPQGLLMADGKTGWHTGNPVRDLGTVDDVAFVTALLDRLVGQYCIDPERVWVTGHSNGGGMTGLLACRASDRFRAFVAIAGAFYLAGDCPTAVPRPFLELHGVADATVPYEGGGILPSVVEYVGEVAARNGCDATPSVEGVVTTWAGCTAPVAHVAWPDQGHAYPEGAAGLVWEFLTTGAVTA